MPGFGALTAQVALPLELAFQPAALCCKLVAPLSQLLQADHLGLVGIEQPGVGAAQPVEARQQLPLGSPLLGRAPVRLCSEVPELGGQAVGIGEQVADVAPNCPLQGLAVDVGPRTGMRPAGSDAVLAAAPVVAPHATRRQLGRANHGQPTATAGQQAAKQVSTADRPSTNRAE